MFDESVALFTLEQHIDYMLHYSLHTGSLFLKVNGISGQGYAS